MTCIAILLAINQATVGPIPLAIDAHDLGNEELQAVLELDSDDGFNASELQQAMQASLNPDVASTGSHPQAVSTTPSDFAEGSRPALGNNPLLASGLPMPALRLKGAEMCVHCAHQHSHVVCVAALRQTPSTLFQTQSTLFHTPQRSFVSGARHQPLIGLSSASLQA